MGARANCWSRRVVARTGYEAAPVSVRLLKTTSPDPVVTRPISPDRICIVAHLPDHVSIHEQRQDVPYALYLKMLTAPMPVVIAALRVCGSRGVFDLPETR